MPNNVAAEVASTQTVRAKESLIYQPFYKAVKIALPSMERSFKKFIYFFIKIPGMLYEGAMA